MPLPQTPVELQFSCYIVATVLPSLEMKRVGLYKKEHFGAQYIHLRCSLVYPFLQLHLVCYLSKCEVLFQPG